MEWGCHWIDYCIYLCNVYPLLARACPLSHGLVGILQPIAALERLLGSAFGLGLYHYHPYWLYFVAFAVVLLGLITYFWHSAREYIEHSPFGGRY